ncbi:MAG: LysM peptidoglycan-binding domain-containing protein [Opitutaceae bacterium]|nr:LysM peptidoglycan-binding domain-containing protein [Opitutaceae bacterium]
MLKTPGPVRNSPISRRNRALLTAALVALGTVSPVVRAQADLATIRARAEQGEPEALNALGNAYANGAGVPQDFAQALRCYQQAAERGLAPAHFNLGMMHELGRGVAANPAAAFPHYLKAAELGFGPAQFNVGNMYANGIGVRQDHFEAALWFRQAADRNIAEAQYNLALAYELGRGVAKDEAAAQRWYRVAAAQGYARAQYNLALMLEEGRGGAAETAAAIELYRAAALQNYAPAQNNLGILLAEGRGAPADLVQAYTWLALAVENGTKPTGRDLVGQQLSPAQLAQGNTALGRLRAQISGRDTAPAPTVAAATPAAPRPASSGADEQLRAENVRLAESAAALARDKAALEERLAAVTSTKVAVPASDIERQQLAKELAALNATLAEARESASRLAAENTQLRKTAATQPPKKAAQSSAELEALRMKVEQLSAESAAWRAEKVGLQRQADDLAAQLKAARDTPATAASTPAAAVADTSSVALNQLAASDARIAKLLNDNSRLNDEVKRSTIELTNLTRQLRLAQEKAAQSDPAAAADDGKVAGLNRQIEQLQAEHKKMLDENRRLAAVSSSKSGASGDEARLRAENEQLKQAVAAAAAATRERDALRVAREALEGRVAELSQRTAGPDAQQLRTDLAKAREAQAEAERKLAASDVAARTERERMQAQLSELQRSPRPQPAAAETATLRAERDKLAADKRAAEQELRQAKTQLSEAQTLMGKIEQANGAFASRVDTLVNERDRLAAAQAAAPNPQARTAEMEQARQVMAAEKTALERRVAELANQLRDNEQMSERREQANRNLSGQVDALKVERDRLANAARTSGTERETVDKLSTQLEGAGRSIAELNAKNDSLQKDLEVAKQSVAAALAAQAAAAKAAPSDAMKLEMQTMQNHIRLLETQLEDDRKNSAREISTLAGQLQSARESNRALVEANRALLQARGSEDAVAKSEVDQLNARLKSTQTDLEKARTELATLQTRFAESNQAAERHGSTVAELTGLNEKLGQEKAALERQATEWRQGLEQARAELAELKQHAGTADRTAQQQVAAMSGLTSANEKLQAQVQELGAQVKSLQSENTRLAAAAESTASVRAELTELRTRLAEAQKAAEQQGSNVAQLSGANERLSGELKDLQAQLATVRAENVRLVAAGETAARTRSELAELRSRLVEAQKTAEQHGSTVAELTGANERLAGEMKDLQAQLVTMRAENTRLAQSELGREEAEQRAAKLSTAANQLAATQRDLATARAEIARLSDTVQALDRDRTTRVTQLQQENAAITARLRQAQGTLDQIASAARLINSGSAGVSSMPASPLGSGVAMSSVPTIPVTSAPAAAPQARTHVVAEGDSLTRISARYYGTGSRWQEIYEANRDVLRGENALRPGQRLRVP